MSTPLNQQAWIQNLTTDPDRDFIIDGITNGCQIIPSDSILEPADIANYTSATASDIRDKVENQIGDEIRNGKYDTNSTLGAIPNQTLTKSDSYTTVADRNIRMSTLMLQRNTFLMLR